MTAALEAHALRRTYGDLVALDALDLDISSGETVALIGPNGAGKTTLLSMAAGLLEPSGGTVHVCGFPAGSMRARAATSYIPDTPVLYDDLSLEEHLEYIARLHAADDWAIRAPRLLEHLALDEWREYLPSQFSRGMRQKASIALGLIRPFSLLLADEPFDGLDPPSRAALIELLREARDGGAAVVVSTHRVEVAEIATRCIALQDGEVTYDGPPDRAVLTGRAPSADELLLETRPGTRPEDAVLAEVSERLSLSTARFEDLRAVGMSAPQALEVLRFRETHRRFRTVYQLEKLPGFSREAVAELTPRVRA